MRSSGLRDTGVLLLGASVGAGLMFLLDPRGGAARRARVRDKIMHFGRLAADRAERRRRDYINRVRGQALEWRARAREGRIDDDTLVERARAQIGHVASHPGALEIHAHDGVVILRGPVLRGERARIEHRLNETRGVQGCDIAGVVEHDSAENFPGLQGQPHGRRKAGS